ncbi:GNAT family N-acetyltransferase [Pseudaestuariivita atlantica]|uniref:N-acetyltransferase domain-containing protein n=1 Tax=Pseudaestuariivita atlantica TaxID=1317121 RepID=A0A0L1JQU8_9RHOB|nr:GNAT family N-acetyltransferase [Pseudaestuariivita atlantica]KNG94105.1 hypothetical protein ATO11_07630 [Pseudaestuariivita atlantica]
MSGGPALRAATPLDAGRIGALFSAFVDDNDWMPRLHTRAEDVAHAGTLISRGWVTVADDAAGFLARDGEVIHALYVHRDRRGEGLGSALLAAAKEQSDRLRLWTFQANARAQAFYLARGFTESLRTDGRTNDERLPDIEYIWRRDP